MIHDETPLTFALKDHWNKAFAELPHDLQLRIGPTTNRVLGGFKPKYDERGNLLSDTEGNIPVFEESYLENHVGGFLFDWDSLGPEQRLACAAQHDLQNQPESEAEKYYWELGCKKIDIETKIRELELSNHRHVPSEILVRDENLKLLAAELAVVKNLIREPYKPAVATECEATSRGVKSVFDQKGSLIVDWLIENGYDPLSLPVQKNGMPGVKSECRSVLQTPSKFTHASFKSTWDRLRQQGKLKDAT